MRDHQNALDRIDVACCEKTPEGYVLWDQAGRLVFTEQGALARIEARRKLVEEESLEIQPILAQAHPTAVNEIEREALMDIALSRIGFDKELENAALGTQPVGAAATMH